MKKPRLLFLVSSVAVTLFSQPVLAQPFAGPMATDSCETEPGTAVKTPCQAGGNPEIYEAIEFLLSTTGKPSLGLNSNADTDTLQSVGNPAYWDQLGGGEPSSVAVIAIGADNRNTLGVFPFGSPGAVSYIVASQQGYDILGSGTLADPFPGGIIPLDKNFGFALKTQHAFTGNSKVWYSDPTLNTDKIDHMLSFDLPQLKGGEVWIDLDGDKAGDQLVKFQEDTYLLAWEDLAKTDPNFNSDYNDTIFLITRIKPPVVPEPASMLLFGTGLAGMLLRRKKV